MIQKERHVVTGIDQDTAPDKRKPDVCYDSENIRIINNGRHLSIKPIGSSTTFVTSASLGTSNIIIGSIEINDLLYIFTTDDEGTDRIASISTTGTLTDIITGDFDFDSDNRIEAVANYENEDIIKIYWTDGENILRFVNVIDPSTQINIVEDIALDQLSTGIIPGGNLIAGNIQHTYNLYNLNGSESVLSPLSEILSTTNYMDGFTSGESSGLSVEMTATIDTSFEFIRLYSVHWKELNQTPTITLIADEHITDSAFAYTDDGNSFVSELSEAEFTSIGGRPIIAQTLAAKRNRLFLGNVDVNEFDVNIDVRAFAHSSASTNYGVSDADGSNPQVLQLPTVPDPEEDAVNTNYNTYKFIQSSSTVWGAEGVNVRVSVVFENTSEGIIPEKSLKRGEIYRIGIIFYNSLGQKSPAKWVTDMKMPHIEDEDDIAAVSTNGFRNLLALQVVLKNQSSYTAAGVEKYQLVAVERTENDRTIISQGVIQPTVKYFRGDNQGGDEHTPYYHPYYCIKDLKTIASTVGLSLDNDFEQGVDWINTLTWSTTDTSSYPVKHDEFCVFYSADTVLGEVLPSVNDIKIVGSYQNSTSLGRTKLQRYEDGVTKGSQVVNTTVKTTDLDDTPNPGSGFPYVLLGGSGYTDEDIPIEVYEAVYLHRYSGTFLSPETSTPDIELDAPSKNFNNGEIGVFDSSYSLGNTVSIDDLITLMITGSAPVVKGTQITYYNTFPGCTALKFDADDWHETTNPWDKFVVNGDRDADLGTIPLIELTRELSNQYGGFSYEAKQRNSYLIEGTLGDVSDTTINYVGDIYIAPFIFQRSNADHILTDQAFNLYDYIYVGFLEHNQNVFGRSDDLFEVTKSLDAATQYQNFRLEDNHQLLTAYNQKPNIITAPSKPVNFNTVNKFSNLIQASEQKFSNELIDSWTQFPVNDTREVEGIYGPITKLHNFKGEIYSLQESAIAHISINPRIQTQATDGVNIELGIGAVLYDHKYLTTVSGTADKFTVNDDGQNLFYYDGIYNTINTLADNKISTLKGVRQILEDSSGVISTLYNREQDEVLFSFSNFVLVYNSLLQKFVTRETETSDTGHLMKLNDSVFFVDGSSNIAKKYNGVDYLPTSVTYLFSPAVTTEKVFHNLEYRMFGDIDIENVLVIGNLNVSDLTAVTTFNKFDIRRLHLPRISGTRQRFREPYILVEVQSNTGITTGDFSLDDMVIMYNIKG